LRPTDCGSRRLVHYTRALHQTVANLSNPNATIGADGLFNRKLFRNQAIETTTRGGTLRRSRGCLSELIDTRRRAIRRALSFHMIELSMKVDSRGRQWKISMSTSVIRIWRA
jgi:hypothetical protein